MACIRKAAGRDENSQVALVLTRLSRFLGRDMKTHCLLVLCFTCLLCGCSGTDYTYVDTNEEKPGPGLFSGDDGVFTVIKKGPEEVEGEQEPAEKTSSQ